MPFGIDKLEYKAIWNFFPSFHFFRQNTLFYQALQSFVKLLVLTTHAFCVFQQFKSQIMNSRKIIWQSANQISCDSISRKIPWTNLPLHRFPGIFHLSTCWNNFVKCCFQRDLFSRKISLTRLTLMISRKILFCCQYLLLLPRRFNSFWAVGFLKNISSSRNTFC